MLNMSCLDSRHYVSISFKSVRYDRRAEGVSAESDVQNVSVSERKHKVFPYGCFAWKSYPCSLLSARNKFLADKRLTSPIRFRQSGLGYLFFSEEF